MTWGSTGGGGVSAAPGTPEAAAGADALRDRGSGPPDDGPKRRPGCMRAVVALIVVLILLAVLITVVGWILPDAIP